ncbi:MAG: hypothetical protein RL148_84 [Planctomycetota bacterium]
MPAPMTAPLRILWRGLLLLAALLPAVRVAAQDPEKVTVETRMVPAQAAPGQVVTLEVVLTIADTFHVYGAKDPVGPTTLKLAKVEGVEAVGEAVVPAGTPHEAYGTTNYWVESSAVLKQKVRVLPGVQPGKLSVAAQLDYMVCDENSCDPPVSTTVSASLEVVAAEAGAEQPVEMPATKLVKGGFAGALGLGGGGGGKLRIEASFVPAVARAGERVVLRLECEAEVGWHVYGHKDNEINRTKLTVQEAGGLVRSGELRVPDGEPHELGNETNFWLEGPFTVDVAFDVPSGAAPGESAVAGMADYIACTPDACDPPAQTSFRATLQVEAGDARAEFLPKASASGPSGPKPADGPGDSFGGMLGLVLLSIGGGLFALAMPCTYPMIPITFSFFTKQAERRGGNVLALALAYGIGIVLMFVLIGVAVGPVIIAFANHWVTNSVLALGFVFFALVLFGVVNLQPPAAVQNAAGKASATGGLLGVFFMGATLVITSFTCTAPIVGTLLGHVGASGEGLGDVAIGMAVFGLTMAAPFVALALLPGRVKQLPKAGEWMDTLKVTLGFVELAAALKFVSNVDLYFAWNILPRELFLLACAAILLLASLYLFGLIRAKGSTFDGVGAGRMTTGGVFFGLAFYLLYGAMGFKLDFIMTQFAPPYSAESVISRGDAKAKKGHELVKDDFSAALALARKQDKLLLANFTGFN